MPTFTFGYGSFEPTKTVGGVADEILSWFSSFDLKKYLDLSRLQGFPQRFLPLHFKQRCCIQLDRGFYL